MKFWNREAETMSRDQYADVQLKGLQKSLRRVWMSEWSRKLLLGRGFGNPEDVKSLDDLKRIPFLTKDDFRDAYPLQMSTVPRKDLLEFHQSSGLPKPRLSSSLRLHSHDHTRRRDFCRPFSWTSAYWSRLIVSASRFQNFIVLLTSRPRRGRVRTPCGSGRAAWPWSR